MKTFRNVVAALGILLLLYGGAYWRFAREDMRGGYLNIGPAFSSDVEWSDWRKFFVPVASMDYRMNVVRPLRKRLVGHWKSANSEDFVTFARDGQCSFRIGEIEHAGKAEILGSICYTMDFERDRKSYNFSFLADPITGENIASVDTYDWGNLDPDAFLPDGERTEVILTKSPD